MEGEDWSSSLSFTEEAVDEGDRRVVVREGVKGCKSIMNRERKYQGDSSCKDWNKNKQIEVCTNCALSIQRID